MSYKKLDERAGSNTSRMRHQWGRTRLEYLRAVHWAAQAGKVAWPSRKSWAAICIGRAQHTLRQLEAPKVSAASTVKVLMRSEKCQDYRRCAFRSDFDGPNGALSCATHN